MIWDDVWKKVTAIKDPERGAFEPSINALDEETAVQITEKIVTVQAMVEVQLMDKRSQT